MATYETLRQAINSLIKTNGNEEITGAILNQVLNAMITALGANYQFCGEATPSTNPGQPMQNVFYFAYDAGTYVNFGNITLPMGISTLSWDGTQWTGDTIYQIDSTPILNSTKLITSGAVYNTISRVYNGIGSGKVFAGIAVPSTTPEPINGIRMFYIATQAGTYEHFFANGDITLVLPHDGLYVIYSTTEDDDWNWEEIVGFDDVPTSGSDNLVRSGGVFNELALGAVYDVSAKNPTAGPNNDGKWESLSALLSDANLNTLIPISVRKGGMSVKFVRTSDNNYVQFRYMSSSTAVAVFTNVANWQGVTNEIAFNSKNLPTSHAVEKAFWTGEPDTEIDLSDYEELNYFINDATNTWININSGNYKCKIIPITAGKRYVIKTLLNSSRECSYAMLTTNAHNIDSAVSYATGYTGRVIVAKGDENIVLAPANARYMFVATYVNGVLNPYVAIYNKQNIYSKFLGEYDSSTIDTFLSSGLYKGKGDRVGNLLQVVKKNSRQEIQTEYYLHYFSDNVTTELNIRTRKTEDAGATWSDWQKYLGDEKRIIAGTFTSSSQIDSKIETGIWQGNGSILSVRRIDANLIYQYHIFTTQEEISGKVSIRYRASDDNGETWSNWENYSNEYEFKGNYSTDSDLDTLYGSGKEGIYKDEIRGQICCVRLYIRPTYTRTIQIRYGNTTEGRVLVSTRIKQDNNDWSEWSTEIDSSKIAALYSENPTMQTTDIKNPKYTVVSDSLNQTAADLGDYLIDAKKMHGVAIHLSSTNNYYETEGVHTIDIWSLMNPNQAKHFDVNIAGEIDSEGNAIGKPALCFFRQIDRNLRIVFGCKGGANEEYPWYKDFNLDTYQGGVATPILYNGSHIDITVFNTLLNAAGYPSDTKNEGGPRIIGRINGPVKTENVEGTDYDYVYCLVHMNQYAIIMKTKDNFANLEYVSVFPYPVEYEGTIMYLPYNSRFYIYYRTSNGMRLTTTTDFVTYTEIQAFGDLTHRGQMCVYDDYIYLTSTWRANINPLAAVDRTNFTCYKGRGTLFSEYEQILHITDAAGTVSPVMLPLSGTYTMVFTTSPFHSDWINRFTNKNHMGKDCLAFYTHRYLEKAADISLAIPY